MLHSRAGRLDLRDFVAGRTKLCAWTLGVTEDVLASCVVLLPCLLRLWDPAVPAELLYESGASCHQSNHFVALICPPYHSSASNKIPDAQDSRRIGKLPCHLVRHAGEQV